MDNAKINTGQSKRIHQLLTQLGLMDEKMSYVRQYSSGRTASSTGLFHAEAQRLITDLEKASMTPESKEKWEKTKKMRNKVCALLHHEMGWTYAEVDEWCVKRGAAKKKLFAHSYEELPTLVGQAEKAHKSWLENKAKQ